VHESLVQGWPTLRRWLDENQDDAGLVDQLRVAARQWQQKGFDAGLLWRGDSADEARKFRLRYKGPLSDVERGFLDAVVNYETAQARRRRAAIIGGFAALSLIVVATMVLLVIIQKSRAEAKDNLVTAEIAQKQAEENLEGMQKKERERVAAEDAKTKIAAAKVVVDQQLGTAQEDLAETNKKLIIERDNATESAKQAQSAQIRAEASARAAERAQSEAVAAKDDTIKANLLLQNANAEKADRIKRLEDQIGKMINELK
jgi:hypothetical protein